MAAAVYKPDANGLESPEPIRVERKTLAFGRRLQFAFLAAIPYGHKVAKAIDKEITGQRVILDMVFLCLCLCASVPFVPSSIKIWTLYFHCWHNPCTGPTRIRPYPMFDFECIGNLHIHSVHSDGKGTVQQIAESAAKVASRFHHYHGPLVHDGCSLFERGGSYGKVLVRRGFGVRGPFSHYLAFDLKQRIAEHHLSAEGDRRG